MTRERHAARIQLLLALVAVGIAGACFLTTPAGHDALVAVGHEWLRIGAWFRVANTSTPLLPVLLPALLFGALVYVITLVDPRASRWSRAGVILLLAGLYSTYMAYRLFATLNFSNIVDGAFSILFFLAELLIYLKALSAYFQMFWQTNRSPDAARLSEMVTSGRYLPAVDILVPSYNEPVEMLRRTILGCQSLRYQRKEIYLLDDQRRPEMRALARQLGCHYRQRPDHRDAKAGNLNAALPTTRGELIAVFDADFIPTEDFLERTVGFFTDDRVGLVQTPQNFYSVDAVSRNLGLPGVITEEQQVFFRAVQPGRDTMGAMICHGTSFIVRRKALEEIGNFPGETLSEDWATSIKLQSIGYKTCYLNELLSAGAAAEFTSEFVSQRLRWARGTLQSFFVSTNPLTVPGLTMLQRLAHLCGPLHYIPFVSRLFCLLLPLFFFFFGIMPLETSAEMLLLFFLPYWLCQALTLSWLTGGHRSAFWSEVYETMLCYPMTLTVISTFLRPFGKPFKVSKKGETKSGLTLNPFVGIPLIVLFALYIPAVIYGIVNAESYASRGIFALAMGWSVYSMILLWLSLQASLDVPHPCSSLRFKHQLPATLRCRGLPVGVMTEAISDMDVVVKMDKVAIERMHAARSQGATVTLSIPAFGLSEVPVSLLDSDPSGHWTFELDKLPVEQHRALVASLYCRPGQWDERGVPERVTFRHFLHAPFRMYPLAQPR